MKKLLTIAFVFFAFTSYGQYTKYQLYQKIDQMSTYRVDYMRALSDSIVKSMALQSSISNVDNTSDANKPVSTAQGVAIDAAKRTEYGVACSDLSTPLTAGTTKAYFRIPRGFTVTAVRASLLTAQSSGNIFTVDVNEAGGTILSTKITIDNTEKTTTTAATAAVISDAALADDSEITIDIDQIGNGTAVGLIVWIIGY